MMKPAAAFQATMHALRTLPQRPFVQIVLEVPKERFGEVAAVFEQDAWVAVARIVTPVAAVPSTPQHPGAPAKEEAAETLPTPPPRTGWNRKSYAQQAGIRCADPVFWAFLREELRKTVCSEDDAVFQVQVICDVETRRDIRPDTDAALKWKVLDDHFVSWRLVDAVS